LGWQILGRMMKENVKDVNSALVGKKIFSWGKGESKLSNVKARVMTKISSPNALLESQKKGVGFGSEMGSPVRAGGGTSVLSSKVNELKARVQKGSARPKNDAYNPGLEFRTQ
jgi:hypothetical protein